MEASLESRARDLLPPAAERSLLLSQGGFGVYDGMAAESVLQMLLEEALQQRAWAQDNTVLQPDAEEFRGGVPERSFLSAPGGDLQDRFYHSPWLQSFLGQLSGALAAPTGGRGTYTYYCRAGDHLGLHRDVYACDVSVITCLHDGPTATAESGMLCLYPQRVFEPLSSIRRTPHWGRTLVRLAPGQTIVVLGGLVPHQLLPVVAGQTRIVSVLCYRLR